LVSRITYADVQGCATQLIENLFGAMNLPGSTENEYLMKGKAFKIICVFWATKPYLENDSDPTFSLLALSDLFSLFNLRTHYFMVKKHMKN